MSILNAMTSLADRLADILDDQAATVTADPRDVPGIIGADKVAVLVTPPEAAWPTWDAAAFTFEVWMIAATQDTIGALTVLDPIITAINDDPDTAADSGRPDMFALSANRPQLPGYILTITT